VYKKSIETKDLILGKIKMKDLESIYKNFYSQDETAKYMLWTPCKTIDEARAKLEKTIEYQKEHIGYCVYEKASNEAIGIVGMIEIEKDVYEDGGIAIGPKYVGKGYGKQILLALMTYVFDELHAKKVICSCDTENIVSKKLQLSCGLKYSHSKENYRKRNNTYFIADFYEITKEEWINRRRV